VKDAAASTYDGPQGRGDDGDVVKVAQAATRPSDHGGVRRSTLSELEESILSFERGHWRRGSSKDDAIRAAFGMSPTAYYLALSRLIDSPEAAAYDPQLVQRLQRRIAERAARRSGNGP